MHVCLCSAASLLLGLALPAPLFAAPAADPLAEVEIQTESVIQLRAEAVRLDAAWQTDRELLASTIAALEDRAARAEEDRDSVLAATAKDREEIAELEAKATAAATAQTDFEAKLAALGQRLVAMRASLPPRLADALDVSLRSLANPELGPGERMQLTVSVLNRCAQFNRMVSFGEEVLAIEPGSEPRIVEVIYWGLSHGYALDRAGERAWFGSPTPEGWRWESRPDLVAPTARLIAIYTDKRDPEYVVAPARLDGRTPAHPAPAP